MSKILSFKRRMYINSKKRTNIKSQHSSSDFKMKNGPEGLKYIDKIIGVGDTPSKFDELEVHYKGWYYDSKSNRTIKFDDSYERDKNKGLLFEYGTSPIIDGWTYGLQTMKKGGKRSILVPPHLGYGDIEVYTEGRPSIPANSELCFDIELININNNKIRRLRRFLYVLLRPY